MKHVSSAAQHAHVYFLHSKSIKDDTRAISIKEDNRATIIDKGRHWSYISRREHLLELYH